ncbi:hypothetical protein ACEPAF_1836 [Sanghuangporus sanghuang]
MTRLTLAEKTSIDDKYVLPRNSLERERLQNQHQIFTEAFNGRLIIDKTVKLRVGYRILDSGTGAASWILDLAKNAAKAVEIVGVDISAAMFPDEIPSNVTLYETSFMELPPSWDGSFDIVNQRLLIAALTIEEWHTTISRLFRVLKPGGSIQITEVGHYATLYESTILPATKICDGYCAAIFQKRNLLGFDCWLQLPVLLEEAGFMNIQVEVQRAPLGNQWGKLGILGAQNWHGVYRSMGVACLEEGGLGVCESQAEIEVVVEQARKEWDENPGVFIQVYAITARKPS